MEVFPNRAFFGLSALLTCIFIFSSCGNRFDLSTERGRQARIDEARFKLSKGQCTEAKEAIDPLMALTPVSDEVRTVKAAAEACFGGFNFFQVAGALVGSTNYFQSVAAALANSPGDGARQAMFNAIDVLTEANAKLSGSQRTIEINNYMVFLQLGAIGAILRNYGSPDAKGVQGANLVYDTGSNPAGEMSNLDACALAAALGHLTDSFANGSLTDSTTSTLVTTLNSVCTAAGLASCASINKDRSACDGTNANSVAAAAVVTSVNTSW
jgi:hypothetical protein